MSDEVKCCYCAASLLVQTRVKGSSIVRSWKCQYCELEIKDDGDVTPEQVVQVMACLNQAPRGDA